VDLDTSLTYTVGMTRPIEFGLHDLDPRSRPAHMDMVGDRTGRGAAASVPGRSARFPLVVTGVSADLCN